ncbi:MAG: hypothetical protein GXW85_00940 [Clostridia bacterium]|nr:hypothetical protein [Clostridia bacterium]
MNKVEVQPYYVFKRFKCNLCDRLEQVEKRLVFWQDGKVIGDLLLCNSCLELLIKIIEGSEEVMEEWIFKGGGKDG